MKCSAPIDPAQCSCGHATAAVRQLLSEWNAIDWLEPPRADAAAKATSSFEQHQRLAHAHQPELFDPQIAITQQTGGWPEFSELCERVRMQRWVLSRCSRSSLGPRSFQMTTAPSRTSRVQGPGVSGSPAWSSSFDSFQPCACEWRCESCLSAPYFQSTPPMRSGTSPTRAWT